MLKANTKGAHRSPFYFLTLILKSMALIKKTAFMAGISGKVQGSVFGQGSTGTYVRNQPKPVGGKTVARKKSNSTLSFVSQQWRELSLEEVQAWNNLAQNTILLNRFGEEYSPSGYNLFCKRNVTLLKANKPLLKVPVASANFPNSNELQLHTYDQMALNVESAIILNNYHDTSPGYFRIDKPMTTSVYKNGLYIGFRVLGLRSLIEALSEDTPIVSFLYRIDNVQYAGGLVKGVDNKVYLFLDDKDIPVENMSKIDITSFLDYFDKEVTYTESELDNKVPLNKLKGIDELIDQSTFGFILVPDAYPSIQMTVNHKLSPVLITQSENNDSNHFNVFEGLIFGVSDTEMLSAFISMNFCDLSNSGELYQQQKGGYTLQNRGTILYASNSHTNKISCFDFYSKFEFPVILYQAFEHIALVPVSILSQIRFLVGYNTPLEEGVALQVFIAKPHAPGRVAPFTDCVYIIDCEDSYEDDDEGPWVDCGDGYHTCPPYLISSFQGSVTNSVGYFGDGFSTTVWARFIDKASGVTSDPVRLSENSKKKVKFKAGSDLSGKVN